MFDSKNKQLVYWPEKNANGYFLAIDSNKNGRIEEFKELFGKENNFENGFEKLLSYDENYTKKLMLIIQPLINEFFFKKTRNEKTGRTEILQESSFIFFNKNKEEKTGKIYDIWFYGVR